LAELINENNGILVSHNDEKMWIQAFENCWLKFEIFDLECIAKDSREKFGTKNIGEQYYRVISKIIG